MLNPVPKPERRSAVKARTKRKYRLTRAEVRQIVGTQARWQCARCGRRVSFDRYPLDPDRAVVNEPGLRSRGANPLIPEECELLCGACHMTARGEHAPTKARMDKLNALAAKAKQLKALARGDKPNERL